MPRRRIAVSLLVAMACFVSVVALEDVARAQKAGTVLESLPPAQREIVEQVVAFSKQYHEAAKLKNKVARQDALKDHETKYKAWIDETNKKLASGSIKEWVGNAAISTQTVALENRVYLKGGDSGTFTTVRVSFPAAGLAPAVREQVGKLKNGEVAKVTFAPGTADPIIFSKTSLASISAQLKSPKTIASISSGAQ